MLPSSAASAGTEPATAPKRSPVDVQPRPTLPEIEVDLSRDYEVFTGDLASYRVMLFYTDLGKLTCAQEEGLLTFIGGGGGFVGV